MTDYTVQQQVAKVTRDIGVVGKSKKSAAAGNYSYRGIEAVMNALNPVLAEHKVTIVPNVVHWERIDGAKGNRLLTLVVRYDIWGPAGDKIESTVVAEGIDNQDKGPGKAMSYAFKAMAAQVFCIPTEDNVDNESHAETFENATRAPQRAPAATPEDSSSPSPSEKPGRSEALTAALKAAPEYDGPVGLPQLLGQVKTQKPAMDDLKAEGLSRLKDLEPGSPEHNRAAQIIMAHLEDGT